jgi:hypothetical protein
VKRARAAIARWRTVKTLAGLALARLLLIGCIR